MAVQRNTTNTKTNTKIETRRNERKKRYRMLMGLNGTALDWAFVVDKDTSSFTFLKF